MNKINVFPHEIVNMASLTYKCECIGDYPNQVEEEVFYLPIILTTGKPLARQFHHFSIWYVSLNSFNVCIQVTFSLHSNAPTDLTSFSTWLGVLRLILVQLFFFFFGVINLSLPLWISRSRGANVTERDSVLQTKHIKVMHKSTSLLWLMYAN